MSAGSDWGAVGVLPEGIMWLAAVDLLFNIVVPLSVWLK
jgi:hypothetical protein